MTPPRKTPPTGRTRPAQAGEATPRLPHEHDESDDSQSSGAGTDGGQREVGQQAFDDLESGKSDTGRMPVTDSTYERLKKPGR
jgi:hypothetical protein